jgi:hypothetical protein
MRDFTVYVFDQYNIFHASEIDFPNILRNLFPSVKWKNIGSLRIM